MSAEICNDKHGCSRKVEDIEDGAVYVCDSKINTHINTACKWTTQAVFLYIPTTLKEVNTDTNNIQNRR